MGPPGFFLVAEGDFGRGGHEPKHWLVQMLCICPPFSPRHRRSHKIKKIPPFGGILVIFGGSAGVRTRDLRLKRALLYLLSYRPERSGVQKDGGILENLRRMSNEISKNPLLLSQRYGKILIFILWILRHLGYISEKWWDFYLLSLSGELYLEYSLVSRK